MSERIIYIYDSAENSGVSMHPTRAFQSSALKITLFFERDMLLASSAWYKNHTNQLQQKSND